MRIRILKRIKALTEGKTKMYEETMNDVLNIIGLKTASDEAKARMIVELMMSHDEPRKTTKKESDFQIISTEPKEEPKKKRAYKIKNSKKNKTWTEKEDLLLFQRYNEELGRTRTRSALYKKLAKEFARTPIAIEIRLMKKGWKKPSVSPTTNQPRKAYKTGTKKIPVTQTEIDTVHRERSMGTPLRQIAKILGVVYKRAEMIDYKIRKGFYVPTKLQNKDNNVDVGQSTKMPKKFSYMR